MGTMNELKKYLQLEALLGPANHLSTSVPAAILKEMDAIEEALQKGITDGKIKIKDVIYWVGYYKTSPDSLKISN
jgi:hypothetical protein